MKITSTTIPITSPHAPRMDPNRAVLVPMNMPSLPLIRRSESRPSTIPISDTTGRKHSKRPNEDTMTERFAHASTKGRNRTGAPDGFVEPDLSDGALDNPDIVDIDGVESDD